MWIGAKIFGASTTGNNMRSGNKVRGRKGDVGNRGFFGVDDEGRGRLRGKVRFVFVELGSSLSACRGARSFLSSLSPFFAEPSL